MEIYTPDKARSSGQKFGPKADNLLLLQKSGYAVPEFLILQECENLNLDLNEISALLPADKFILRSSSPTEDVVNSSNAGQFKSIANLNLNELESAIQTITQDALTKLNSLNGFSIILQRYIEPEYAGIFFTRNPLRGREFVLEYHMGNGEEVVAGKVKPEKFIKYWNENLQYLSHTWMPELIAEAHQIEKEFAWPQDIEWLVKKGKIFIVQTRPLTTITQKDYQESLLIDAYWKNINSNVNYLEKTYLSESVPRPVPLMRKILKDLYAIDGPIASVYKVYGLQYQPNNFMHIIGNELFIDRDQEIQSLLPAFKYDPVQNRDILGTLNPLKIFSSLKNISKLKSLKPNSLEQLKPKLLNLLQKTDHENLSFKTQYKSFIEQYAFIFEINFLLSNLNSKEVQTINLDKELKLNSSGWKGNTLDIADQSEFIGQLKELMELRELTRFLTVKYINTLRAALPKTNPLDLIFYSDLENINNGNIDLKECERNMLDYKKYNEFTLPTKLFRNYIAPVQSKIIQVSPGIVQGKLVAYSSDLPVSAYKDTVLYVQNLTPDLTRYFGDIKAIVAENGGMLSHLSIMAREKGLPVIVGVDQEQSKSFLNQKIEIGGKGLPISIVAH